MQTGAYGDFNQVIITMVVLGLLAAVMIFMSKRKK